MQPSSPIDDDIGLLVIEPDGSSDRPRSVELAEFEEPVKHRAVFSDIEALKLSVIVLLRRKKTGQPTETVVQRLVTKLEQATWQRIDSLIDHVDIHGTVLITSIHA